MGIKITGIVDDCEAREGTFFCGYKVGHPSRLDPGDDIDYVVQLETYENMDQERSKELLPEQLKDRLVELTGFCRIVNSSGFWRDKTVLFIGDRDEYDGYAFGARSIFRYHVYCNDINHIHEDISEFDYIFICGKWYVKQEQNNKSERFLRRKIRQKFGFDKEKVLDSRVWGVFLYSGNCLLNTKGNDNPDKSFYILSFHRFVGWGVALTLFAQHLAYAKLHSMIPVVDLENYITQYIDEKSIGNENVWERFFCPVSDYSIDEVYRSKNVYLCGMVYDERLPKDTDKIRYTKDFKRDLDALRSSLFPNDKKVLGVVYRATDFAIAYNHPKVYAIEEYIIRLKQFLDKIGYDHVFLATEVEEVVGIFRKEFGDKVFFVPQRRYSMTEKRILATVKFDREDDEYKKSLEYLSVLYCLTCCDSIYGIFSGSIRYAKVFKDHYDHFEILSKDIQIPFSEKSSNMMKKIMRKAFRTLKIGDYKSA